MSKNETVFKGTFVSAVSLNNLNILHGFICVENGLITLTGSTDKFLELKNLGYFNNFKVITLKEHEIMIPGFIDCHTHAPQFPNLGVGLDRPLLEWLDKYTFPLEKMYSDVNFAREVYNKVVKSLLCNGTTTACYFGSLHTQGTLELALAALKHCQRALVGKVSMNIKNDAEYYNDTRKELLHSEEFVLRVLKLSSDLVQPILTPRFAVSCDRELMTGLADIAEKYKCRIQTFHNDSNVRIGGLPTILEKWRNISGQVSHNMCSLVQSHISENPKEIECVLKLFPTCKSYSEVYDKCKILNNRCIMAHAVHLDEAELALLSARGVSVAHCPASNTRLRSGLCPVRQLIDHGITVGLGTDVSGGDSASILDAMRRAMDVSTHLELLQGRGSGLDWTAAFYLATMGGAKALSLDTKIGNFQVGKEFDALRIDVFAAGSPILDVQYSVCTSEDERARAAAQRFVHSGDTTNIREVYVKGKRVVPIDESQ